MTSVCDEIRAAFERGDVETAVQMCIDLCNELAVERQRRRSIAGYTASLEKQFGELQAAVRQTRKDLSRALGED